MLSSIIKVENIYPLLANPVLFTQEKYKYNLFLKKRKIL